MKKFLLPEDFEELGVTGDHILSLCMMPDMNTDSIDYCLAKKLVKDSTKVDLVFLVASLEHIYCACEEDDQVPRDLDKNLAYLFRDNRETYKKLYEFMGGRYSKIMDMNDYLDIDSYTYQSAHLDEASIIYGKAFLHCIPDMLKLHNFEPIKFDKKYVEDMFTDKDVIKENGDSIFTDEFKALILDIFTN